MLMSLTTTKNMQYKDTDKYIQGSQPDLTKVWETPQYPHIKDKKSVAHHWCQTTMPNNSKHTKFPIVPAAPLGL